MDKNTITGFVLIALVLIGFSYFSRPSQEEIEQIQHYNDSIAALEQRLEATRQAERAAAHEALRDTNALFGRATAGKDEAVRIGNDLFDLEVATKGGTLAKAILKKYNNQQGQPLTLFGDGDARFDFKLKGNGTTYNTSNYYFTPVEHTDTTLTMRLEADSASYVDFRYAVHSASYIVNFSIVPRGMAGLLSQGDRTIDVNINRLRKKLGVYESKIVTRQGYGYGFKESV